MLLQCNDQIRLLVEAAASGVAAADDGSAAERTRLIGLLADAIDLPEPAAERPATLRCRALGARSAALGAVGRLRYADTFRNGMDPLAILHYLAGVGSLGEVACDAAAVPALDTIDPESCHLSFTTEVSTDAGREAIESAFSFVREDCVLSIEPVDAGPALAPMSVDEDAGGGRRLGPVCCRATRPPPRVPRRPAKPPRLKTSASSACRPTAWTR